MSSRASTEVAPGGLSRFFGSRSSMTRPVSKNVAKTVLFTWPCGSRSPNRIMSLVRPGNCSSRGKTRAGLAEDGSFKAKTPIVPERYGTLDSTQGERRDRVHFCFPRHISPARQSPILAMTEFRKARRVFPLS